jgi:hypothetical protein
MKKRISTFAAALAHAWVGICLGIMVLVVGSIIIYALCSICKTVLPPATTQTNQVSSASNYLIKHDAADGSYEYEEFGGLDPYTYANTEASSAARPGAPDGFTLQYGLDALNRPWIAAGTTMQVGAVIDLQCVSNTAARYTVAICYGNRTLIYSTTNIDSDSTAGDTLTTVTNQPAGVEIERTTDLVHWLPIFTNTIAAGAVQNFTDTAAPAPAAFYRLKNP